MNQLLISHGSLSSSLAVFLSSGRHVSIPLANSMNISLSFPSSQYWHVSNAISGMISTSAFHSPSNTISVAWENQIPGLRASIPSFPKNSSLRFPRWSKSMVGGPAEQSLLRDARASNSLSHRGQIHRTNVFPQTNPKSDQSQ